MTNGEVELHRALISILIELEKINQHLSKLLEQDRVEVDIAKHNLLPPFRIT